MYTREYGYELNLFNFGDLGDLVPRFRVLGVRCVEWNGVRDEARMFC